MHWVKWKINLEIKWTKESRTVVAYQVRNYPTSILYNLIHTCIRYNNTIIKFFSNISLQRKENETKGNNKTKEY